MALVAWAEEFGINPSTLSYRLKHGLVPGVTADSKLLPGPSA